MSNVHQRESKKKELVRVVSERTLATKRAPMTYWERIRGITPASREQEAHWPPRTCAMETGKRMPTGLR
jgi:hypothetical protein